MAYLVLDLLGSIWTGCLGCGGNLRGCTLGDNAQLLFSLGEGSFHAEKTSKPEILLPDRLHLLCTIPEFYRVNRHE